MSADAPATTAGFRRVPTAAGTFEWYSGPPASAGVGYAAQRVRIILGNSLRPAGLDSKSTARRCHPEQTVAGYENVAALAGYLAEPVTT